MMYFKHTLIIGSIFLFYTSCGDTIPNSPTHDLDLDFSAAKNFGSPMLASYSSCEKLSQAMRTSALDELKSKIAQAIKEQPHPPVSAGIEEDAMAAPTSAAPVRDNNASIPQEGIDFSGTNNQEQEVDEADIIKLDGQFFYILNKNTLEILATPQPGELQKASTITLPSSGSSLLLVSDDNQPQDTAVVFAQVRDSKQIPTEPMPLLTIARYPNSSTRIDLINLDSDRKEPNLRESLYFQGNLVAARKINNKIFLATYMHADIPDLSYWPNTPRDFWKLSKSEQKQAWQDALALLSQENQDKINNFDFLSMMPNQLSKTNNNLERKAITKLDCANTYATSDSSSQGFLSLISFDATKTNPEINILRVRGNNPIVYASKKQFILASPEHEPWWFFGREDLQDQTTIHRFNLEKNTAPQYADSARIPGTLHNSFSLSEHNNYLRAATTTRSQGRDWITNEVIIPDENHLFIMGDTPTGFDIISSIEQLAPGEKIWSARFSGDKGFLVTFKRVDPLFTLDLSNPNQPQVAGELKIPGVSTYLQDIGDDHLLAVGYGGDEEGLDFNTTISLFDTSDFENPQLADTLSFKITENTNSRTRVSSEANNNHLAVNYFAPVALTAIPLTADVWIENALDPSGGKYEYLSKLSLVNTQVGKDLSLKGHVDHSRFYNQENFWDRPPQIRRSYFFTDHVYSVSPKAITAHNLTSMEETATYEFP